MKRIILLALCSLLFAGVAWAQTGEATGTADTGTATGEMPMADDNATDTGEQPMAGEQPEDQPLAGEQPMAGEQEPGTMDRQMGQEQEMGFDQMDQDGDQAVTWQEFQQAFPDVPYSMFEEFDLDNTNSLSEQEWEDARLHLKEKGYQLEEDPLQEQQMQDQPMHDQPMHDQPMHDQPMHDQPMQDQGTGQTGQQSY
jgi:phosphatidylinositol-binding clathrin assembly protein